MGSVHEEVRARYGAAARAAESEIADASAECCGGSAEKQDMEQASSWCGGSQVVSIADSREETAGSCCGSRGGSTQFGYSIEELKMLPDGADLALGCGNPTAIATISEGETVVDLGSGGGIDCFLAAARVGDSGRVIGVDMTSDMIELARRNAKKANATNVEFRLGEIEHLPIADNTADLIISNCVINLSPDKPQVFREAFRVLAPGGRFTVSDVVVDGTLSEDISDNVALLTGCIAGALPREAFLQGLREAGFTDVQVEKETNYTKVEHLEGLARESGISNEVAVEIAATHKSAIISARKPEVSLGR